MNSDRALSVVDAINAFANDQGLDLSPDADGPATAFGDMLCNMMHWLSQEIGVEQTIHAVQNGIGAFCVEFGASDEIGPEGVANVYIKVTGWAGGEEGARDRFKIDAHPSGRLAVDGFVVARSAFTVTKGAS